MCGLLQYVSFYGTGIAYIITSATSMRLVSYVYSVDFRLSEFASVSITINMSLCYAHLVVLLSDNIISIVVCLVFKRVCMQFKLNETCLR